VCRIILTYETAAARSVVPQKRGFPAHFVIRQGQELKFRFRLRKPAMRRERRPLAIAYKIIMHYAGMSGVRKRRPSSGTRPIWWAL
jgi:hypothetical protein